MSGLIPIGAIEAAGDITTGALISLPGSRAQGAVDGRIAGVAVDIISNNPDVVADAAAAAAAMALDDEGLARAEVGKNLFNPDARLIGYTLNGSGGAVASEFYSLSGFIPVVAGEPVTLNAARSIALYDGAKAFVSFVDAANATKTVTPSVSGFLRASVLNTNLPTFQIEAGSVATTYQPFSRVLDPSVALSGAAVSNVADSAGLARVTLGKNLYNPATDALDVLVNELGGLVSLAGYRTSDYIAVEASEKYTMSPQVRTWVFFDHTKSAISSSYENVSPQATQTRTAPANAAFVRFSYQVNTTATPASTQIEKGAAATGYEPFRRILDPTVDVGVDGAGALTVARESDNASVTAGLGSTTLTMSLALTSADRNGVFNFLSTSSPVGAFHTIPDSIAPIRTQQGTIGANHGFAFIGRWASHDKTAVDLGSVWTDGAREYVILKIDGTGVWVGGDYTVAGDGSASSATVAPVADLTHVSGATHTTALPQVGSTPQQMYPAIAHRVVTTTLDAAPLSAGRGNEVVIRESYEILDYASLYDLAKSNIGIPYASLPVAAAVRVESEWRIRDGLKMLGYVALTEVAPTALGQTGFFQCEAMDNATTQTRYLPGVKPIGGRDYSAGVAHSALTVSEYVTSSDLHNASVPPTVLLDWRSDLGIGFVMGYEPWKDATSNAERLANAPARLWDLRDTRKIYPNAIMALTPGWGRVEAHGYRAYVTAAERDKILARKTDALAASAALRTLVG